jgi:hypothetical protein
MSTPVLQEARSNTGVYLDLPLTGTDRFVLAGYETDEGEIRGALFGGVEMTELARASLVFGRTHVIWGIIAPNTSEEPLSIDADNESGVCWAAQFSGVHQTTPTRTAQTTNGDSTTANNSVTNTDAGDLIVALARAADGSVTITPDGSLAEVIPLTTANGTTRFIVSSRTSLGNPTAMNFTLSFGTTWTNTAIALVPATLPPLETIFRAEFNGTLDTQLRASYLPEVGAFTDDIQDIYRLRLDGNGYAYNNVAELQKFAVLSPTRAVSDFVMDVVMRTEGSADDWTNVFFRRSGTDSQVMVGLSLTGDVRLSTGAFFTENVIATYAAGLVAQDVALRIEALGSSIKVYVNGILRINETVTYNQTATGIWLQNYNEALPSGRIQRVEVFAFPPQPLITIFRGIGRGIIR